MKITKQTHELHHQLNWKVLLVVFAAAALLITTIIRAILPRTDTLPTSDLTKTGIHNLQTTFSNITFTGSFTPTQSLYPVYQTTLKDLSKTLIPTLIDRFQLSHVDEDDTYWTNETHSLSFDTISNQYHFYRNDPSENPSRIDHAQAESVATEYVNEVLQLNTFRAFTNQSTFFENEDEMTITTAFKATLIEIPFAPSLEGAPVLFSNASDFPLKILIDSSYNVQKFSLVPYTYTFTPLKELSLISTDKAVSNINQGKGAIVSAQTLTPMPLVIDEIVSGELRTVRLEYRYDDNLQLVYPFYRFEGTLTNKNNQTLEAEIITPAVATD